MQEPSLPNSQGSSSGGVLPTATDIKTGLKMVEGSPLDFINANLKTNPAKEVADKILADPNTTSFSAPPSDVAPVTEPTPAEVKIVPPTLKDVEPPLEEVKVPDVKAKTTVDDLLNTLDTSKDKKQTLEDSFKGIRKKQEALETSIKEKEATLIVTSEELDKYRSGDLVPEPIKKEIERLRGFEAMVSLKTTPEFIKEHVEPLVLIEERLNELASEYEIPSADILKEALKLDTRAKKDRYLSQYMDGAGAHEALELLNTYQDKTLKAKLAEETPVKTLTELREKQAREIQQKEETRISTIQGKATKSWHKALTKLKSTGKYPELKVDAENAEHAAFAKDVVERATSEFGKLINVLTLEGTKDLPEAAADILAERWALSEIALSAVESRNAVFKDYREVITKTRENAIYDRPPAGPSIRTGSEGQGPARPDSPLAAADALLKQVLRK